MNQRKAGVILSYISTGVNCLVGLVYVPLLLHLLTKEQYGLYQLMGSLIAYLSIMDFGLSNTTTRYLSQALAAQDIREQQSIIAASAKIYSWIAIVLIILGAGGYFLISPLYNNTLSATELIIAKKIFLLLLFNIAIFIPSNIFVAIINAHENFIFLRGLNLLKIVLQPCVVYAVLSWKADVLYLVGVQTFFTLLVIFLNYVYCRFKLHVKICLHETNKKLLRELTGFSFFIFLHSLMNQVYWRSGQIILGAVAGPVAVANYSIAMQISLFAVFAPVLLSGVFLPRLSALVLTDNNMLEINKIFCKLGRLQFMLISLLLFGFAFLGRTFLNLWLGPGYEICYWLALILISGYVLDVTQNVGIAILQAMQKHAFRAYVYVSMAALNLILSIVWGKHYGEIGCALSTAFCLFLGSGLAINWYYYRIGLDLKAFFHNLFRLLIPIIGAIICGYFIQKIWPISVEWKSFILHGLVLTGVYGSMLWLFGMNSYEKALFLNPLTYVACKLRLKKTI